MCPSRPSPRLLKLEMVTTTKVCYSSTRLPYEPSVQRWGNKKHTHLPGQHLKPIWACNNRRVMHRAPPPHHPRRVDDLHRFSSTTLLRILFAGEKKNLSHLFHITLTMTDHADDDGSRDAFATLAALLVTAWETGMAKHGAAPADWVWRRCEAP